MTWIASGIFVGVIFGVAFGLLGNKMMESGKKSFFWFFPLSAMGLLYLGTNLVLIQYEKHAVGQPVVFTELTDGRFILKGQLESENEYKVVLALTPTAGRRFEVYPGKIFFLEIMPKKGEVFVIGETLEKKGDTLLHTSPPQTSAVMNEKK